MSADFVLSSTNNYGQLTEPSREDLDKRPFAFSQIEQLISVQIKLCEKLNLFIHSINRLGFKSPLSWTIKLE